MSEEDKGLICSVVAIGQQHVLAGSPEGLPFLLSTLREMDRFYDTIGGIIGYQKMVLQLLKEEKEPVHAQYLKPQGHSIETETSWIKEGLEHLPRLAEVWAVGGAGDRLALTCDKVGEPLPAAELQFCGRSLLEGLIRDLVARESLYFKLYGKKVTIPVALMTSHEKQNHTRIAAFLEKNNWFGRGKEAFRLFTQPLVPLVAETGEWMTDSPFQLKVKPGGHGAIWKLALDEGIFDWFESLGKTKGLVRQINNPVAGVDGGLLAFTGIGFAADKSFGFASCPRIAKAAEGTDILTLRRKDGNYCYTLSNIEYTDFSKKGIVDEGHPYSEFPANTNILFFDFQTIREAVKVCPIPGMLINKKNQQLGVRLESTMQNISDVIEKVSPAPIDSFEEMPFYITFNKRRKTLSVAKNAFSKGRPMLGTPEGCLFEMMQNAEELLSEHCGFALPPLRGEAEYLEKGPSFFVLMRPALGPLYSIIGQKIQGGKLAPDAEMQLEIEEVDIKNLSVSGSLLIEAEEGACTLKNVAIFNKGIDREAPENLFWKNQVSRKEAFSLRLEGKSEFIAENVDFKGNFDIFVPNGKRMRAYEEEGVVKFHVEPLGEAWRYCYVFDGDKVRIFR